MSTEENKALIRRLFEAGDKMSPEEVFTMLDPACTFPDLIAFDLPPTLEGYKQFLAAGLGALTDYSNTVEIIVAEGDTVMVWAIQHATHSGLWRGIPATNIRASYKVVACYRFAHDKIIEYRFLYDSLSFLQQIGAVSVPHISASQGGK